MRRGLVYERRVVFQGERVVRLARCVAAVSLVAGCEQGGRLVLDGLEPGDAPNGTRMAAVIPAGGAEGSLDWQSSLGSAGLSVTSSGAATDASGRAFLAGFSRGAPDSGLAQPDSDAFVAAYGAAGEPLWTASLSTPEADTAAGIDSDGTHVFVAGSTSGALAGDPSGFGDAFVAKYTADGSSLWTRQLGSPEPDTATAVSATPGGDVFIVGSTRGALDGDKDGSDLDAFIARYSADGSLTFVRQLGGGRGYDDIAQAVSSAGGGAVFVAGRSFGVLGGSSLGSADAFLTRYSATGEPLWIRQFGTDGFDAAEGVHADGHGNVYVCGQAGGFLAGGPGTVVGGHPFLAKYTADGDLLWELQLEEATMGAAVGVSSDALGFVYVAGYTSAAFGGENLGAHDAFLAKFSDAGERLWAIQPGVADTDRASGLDTDAEGHVLLSQHATSVDGARFDYTLLTRFR
jgi:hypothetical protein